MSISHLLAKGRKECGKLEKFADGCNAMARAFWLGRKVELINDELTYTRSVTSRWMQVVAKLCEPECYIGILVVPFVLFAYAIACIPVAATMGVGIAAKKIALVKDRSDPLLSQPLLKPESRL